MFGAAAEFEDVPLGDAEMLEEHPGRGGVICGLRTAEVCGKIFHYIFEFGVGVAAIEKIEKVFAQG